MLRQNIGDEADVTQSIDFPAYLRREIRVLKAVGVAKPYHLNAKTDSRRFERLFRQYSGMPWFLFLMRRKVASCAFWVGFFFRWQLPRLLRRWLG